jgi:hypothetical protein
MGPVGLLKPFPVYLSILINKTLASKLQEDKCQKQTQYD